jgi:hypothetical protein
MTDGQSLKELSGAFQPLSVNPVIPNSGSFFVMTKRSESHYNNISCEKSSNVRNRSNTAFLNTSDPILEPNK